MPKYPNNTTACSGKKEKRSMEEMFEELNKSIQNVSIDFAKAATDADKKISDLDERLKIVEERIGTCCEDPANAKPADEPDKPKAKTEGEAQAKLEAEARDDSEDNACSCCGTKAYVGKAYVYRDLCAGFKYIVPDRWAAKQAGNGEYDEIWVLYVDGQIDHVLDADEIRDIFVK